VFLNHGSFGACPKTILDLQNTLRDQMEAEPVQFLWRNYDKQLERSRAAVARFFGARPRDLVFVTNATTAINSVLRSAKIRPGDEVLTTDHDYNACHNVLDWLLLIIPLTCTSGYALLKVVPFCGLAKISSATCNRPLSATETIRRAQVFLHFRIDSTGLELPIPPRGYAPVKLSIGCKGCCLADGLRSGAPTICLPFAHECCSATN
jgi:hypothetical protein